MIYLNYCHIPITYRDYLQEQFATTDRLIGSMEGDFRHVKAASLPLSIFLSLSLAS